MRVDRAGIEIIAVNLVAGVKLQIQSDHRFRGVAHPLRADARNAKPARLFREIPVKERCRGRHHFCIPSVSDDLGRITYGRPGASGPVVPPDVQGVMRRVFRIVRLACRCCRGARGCVFSSVSERIHLRSSN